MTLETETNDHGETVSDIFGDEYAISDGDFVEENDDAGETEEAGTSDTVSEEPEKQADAEGGDDVSTGGDNDKTNDDSEGVEAKADTSADEQNADDATSEEAKKEDDQEDVIKAFKDKYSAERDARKRQERALQKDIKAKLDDGAEIEDLAEHYGLSEKEVKAIAENKNLEILDNPEPMQAKGMEIQQAIQEDPETYTEYAKDILGRDDIRFDEMAFNVSMHAQQDGELQEKLMESNGRQAAFLIVRKYKELESKGLTVSQNPIDDVRRLRQEKAELKAELDALKSARSDGNEQSQDTPPPAEQETAKQEPAQKRPKMTTKSFEEEDDYNAEVDASEDDLGIFSTY